MKNGWRSGLEQSHNEKEVYFEPKDAEIRKICIYFYPNDPLFEGIEMKDAKD
jgi:hypothetical protein